MSARSKKSRLVRTRRLSDSDSSSTETDARPAPATPSWPPSTCRMSGPGEPSSSVSPVVTSWRRAAVRAVEIQESKRSPAAHVINNNTRDKVITGNGQYESSDEGGVVIPPDVIPGPGSAPTVTWSDPRDTWSDPREHASNHGSTCPTRDGGGDTEDTESCRSSVSTHSSVLVDMGKVVGVLRSYPGVDDHVLDDDEDNIGSASDFDLSDDNFLSESPPPSSATARDSSARVCATCAQEAKGQESELEDSLFGDPLVYATFVATVQQYSTETEPSRQTSFNSRQPSFKQNSSEAESQGQQQPEGSQFHSALQQHLHVPLGSPGRETRDIYPEPREARDIYASCVGMSGPGPASHVSPPTCHVADTVSETVSTADLNHQCNQERLSFIHSQESSEEPDYDQVPLSSVQPLPPVPGIRHQTSLGSLGWEGGEESDPGQSNNTVKRRVKRERNHVRQPAAINCHVNNTVSAVQNCHRRSKSRSKSRSPGREIDRAAIVIVHHHTTCGHVTRDRQCHDRTASPDNLSESSISFHENEVNFDLSPGSMTRPIQEPGGQVEPEPMPDPPGIWYDGPIDPCVSVSREPVNKSCETKVQTLPSHSNNNRTIQYSNWESCRESWFSSGSSELRPSSGSDGQAPNMANNCTKPHVVDTTKSSAPTTPHLKRTREAGTSTGTRVASPGSATLPRSAVTCGLRQSSRDSGSSSSRPNSRPGTRPNTRSDSPGPGLRWPVPGHQGSVVSVGSGAGLGGSVCSVTSSSSRHLPAGGQLLHRQLHPPLSRDSTPSESGCSSGPSAPSASDCDFGVCDLSGLEPCTEESLIDNLFQRFKRDQIYTAVSTLLVSINPYKKLSLYTPDVIDKYRSHCLHQIPPHIYSLADRAWHKLRDRGEDQAIVLTGESGAGKTEAGKLVMQYIAAVTGHSRECQDIKYQLLQSNPVLEGLGNARTLHNENSSRFGKYIEICFDFKGDPTGGTITNYWIEKSRVTSHSPSERNFHIFYQLLAGADVHLLKELRLQRNLDSYHLLSTGGSQHRTQSQQSQNFNDRRDFTITKRAMEDIGLRAEEICDIFKIVASVLKLGNLQFVPTTNMDGTEGCGIANEYELYDVGHLLKADNCSLRSVLLSKYVEINNESLVSDLSSVEAENIRDSLCRTLYSRLFTYVVTRINESIKVTSLSRPHVLGILDIYGFEAFQQNGFEQFLINYANEKLQQLFIENWFKREQEEYLAEGVEWSQVGFFSNTVICQLIETSSRGIFSLLDEFSLGHPGPRINNGATNTSTQSWADQNLLDEMNSSLSSHPHYEPSSGSGDPDGAGDNEAEVTNPVPSHSFRIKHYAGSVTYCSQGFLAKNCDVLERDLSSVMFSANHPLLRILFPEGNTKRTMRRRPATLGTQFKISIGALLTVLSNKTCHYVRCIKPNENRMPRVFDMTLVQHQIRYLGLVELARLRRHGFAFRDSYGAFLSRFKMLCHHTWPSWHGPAVEGVTYLLRELPISAKEYAFGRTRIFIRSVNVVDQLEDWRRDRLDELATLLQKTFRGWRARQSWNKLRESQIVICTYWKRWKDKSHITELKQRRKQEWAVVIIQKYYRRWQVARWLLDLAHTLPSESPICRDWPRTPSILKETSFLLRKLYHKWRCDRFRTRFDQTARNRMREKVTASLIFKDRKSSYPRSICHPFLGDYVRLRQNPQWKKMCSDTNDQYVVFADIINKITRTGGKFVPILFVISTSSMLILDQRTMQIKYRVPAAEIFKLSLSPYFDDIAVFHVRASSPTRELRSQPNIPGCLSSEAVKRKGDFVFQTGHVIEIVTKLFLVVQNATGKPPAVNINTQFDANFGTHSVTFQFKSGGQAEVAPGHVKLVKRGNKMEVLL